MNAGTIMHDISNNQGVVFNLLGYSPDCSILELSTVKKKGWIILFFWSHCVARCDKFPVKMSIFYPGCAWPMLQEPGSLVLKYRFPFFCH